MWRPALLGLCSCGILVSSAFAQDARVAVLPRKSDRPLDTTSVSIRVDSRLVLVPVSVTDWADQFVTGLGKENFRVFDDNMEQQISHFASEDAPVSVALVLDASGSMEKKLDKAKEAVLEFVDASNPADEFTLIEVNQHPRVLMPFTSELADIQAQLPLLQSGGRTALLDAICIALSELKHARHSRKAIVIMSDGGDNASRYKDRQVMRLVREADVQIYSIGIFSAMAYRWDAEEVSGPRLLSELAVPTGGRLFEINRADELTAAAGKIGSALRNQYILGYSPSSVRFDGKYHRITVKVQQSEGAKRFRTTFRSSYFAPAN
jgi:Ca-activated chloride channel homolog